MWVLFLGDVVGKPGRKAVAEFLSRLRGVRDVDLVIANGENAASGMGLTDAVVRELFESGVDVLTGGNHVWDKKEGIPLVRAGERILLSLIHISEPTRQAEISYAVFCLKKKKPI